MKINKEIDDLINDTINSNKYVSNGKGIFIKKWQINILKQYGIDISKYSKLSDVIFIIDNLINTEDLNEEEYNELEGIVSDLQEKQYYQNTNK